MPYTNLRLGRHSASGLTYHLTTATDGRKPVFNDLVPARTVIREMKALHDEGMADTLCFVLMPGHLHWLMTLRSGRLADVMRMLKVRTAKAIGRRVWQPNYYGHAVREDEDLRALARYIVANPLRSGLVERIGDYPWDAARLLSRLRGYPDVVSGQDMAKTSPRFRLWVFAARTFNGSRRYAQRTTGLVHTGNAFSIQGGYFRPKSLAPESVEQMRQIEVDTG